MNKLRKGRLDDKDRHESRIKMRVRRVEDKTNYSRKVKHKKSEE